MDLFAVLHATWPAAAETRLGSFTLRDGRGGGKRASAATLDGERADPDAALAAMRARGERPLFMVRQKQEALDERLAALGFEVVDPTVLYAAPAEAVGYSAADLTVIDCEGQLAALRELWADGGVGEERLAVMARVAGAKRYLLGRLDDHPAGAAFVASHGGVAMLHALHVATPMRRRGLGSRLAQAAAAWGISQRAATFALAVEEANTPARALYEALGMAVAGGYHYRLAPV
jgi:N-acetylglutamate synthase